MLASASVNANLPASLSSRASSSFISGANVARGFKYVVCSGLKACFKIGFEDLVGSGFVSSFSRGLLLVLGLVFGMQT